MILWMAVPWNFSPNSERMPNWQAKHQGQKKKTAWHFAHQHGILMDLGGKFLWLPG